MSHKQPRNERGESAQYRKTGRSGSFNQQRQFSGVASAKDGGRASSTPSSPSNRSFNKRYNNNTQGQPRPRSPNVSSDSSKPSAAPAVQNGALQQQPTRGQDDEQSIYIYKETNENCNMTKDQTGHDAPVTSMPATVKPMGAQDRKVIGSVSKPMSSNVPSAAQPPNVSSGSESKAPTTLAKTPRDASGAFPLQFGSISPGVMNGVQIPARTSSAPPNLDERKKAQARHESLRAAPSAPSIPKQQLSKKGERVVDQTNSRESAQYRKIGRSGSFNQQRQFLGGAFAKGGGVIGLRQVQVGNYGVLRNPRAQAPVHGGILSGPMQSLGPGLQKNNSESDRWQHGANFQKGLMSSLQGPMPVIHRAEKKYKVGKVTKEEQAKQRKLKGILNKLMPKNFGKLFQQVKEVNIDNVVTLSGMVSQIFDKALMESTFCEMYANLCFHLSVDLPDLSADNEKITFKRLLLNRCQEEFERGEREEEEANKAEAEGESKQTAEEREEKRLQTRRRMLGNIRLIGELYKKRMLTERIMHECINKLLGQHENPDEENIEALCELMSTIGEMIDHPRAKEHMDYYFNVMLQLSSNMKLSPRVRFMLRDSIDLRKNKWQHRRKVEGPKKIIEVHRDAPQERHTQSTRLAHGPSFGTSVRRAPIEFAPRAPNMLASPISQMVGFRPVISVPMQSLGLCPQRNNSESDRWQRRANFQKGLMSSPQGPMPVIQRAEKYEVGKVTGEEQAKRRQLKGILDKLRRLKGILDKLTPQNFEKLFQQVKDVNIDDVVTLSGVVSQIFDKALMEPTFCEMYANFCFLLSADLPDLSVDNQKITFKRILLNKCQEEFERGEREEEEANKAEAEVESKQTAQEREEKQLQTRRRMLGNIRLIGELYKKRMLTERIMHECINKLLGQLENPDEENIEALCELMSTIGEMIDHPRAKEHMDYYFNVMLQLSNNMKLSSRVRFMLIETIDLRKNEWHQRLKVEGP